MIKTLLTLASILTLTGCAAYPAHIHYEQREFYHPYHPYCTQVVVSDTWGRRHMETVCR
jgi:uncharacterized lipoprotein YajG